MSWFLKATRKAIKFYHETDLDNLYSIINQGIKPGGGALGFDDYGRAEMTFYGTYFGKDEQSTSHGFNTKINRKMMLQGWLPMSFVEENGIADADYIYRMENYYSANFYPNADYSEEADEITHKLNPKTKKWEPDKNPHSWDKSYWQKPYGAAAVVKTIPFDWVENIRIGKRWFPRREAISLLTKELDRQKNQYNEDTLRSWQNWEKQNRLFRISDNLPLGLPEVIEDTADRVAMLKKEYETVKYLLTTEEIKTTDTLFNMKERNIETARQKSKEFLKGNQKVSV